MVAECKQTMSSDGQPVRPWRAYSLQLGSHAPRPRDIFFNPRERVPRIKFIFWGNASQIPVACERILEDNLVEKRSSRIELDTITSISYKQSTICIYIYNYFFVGIIIILVSCEIDPFHECRNESGSMGSRPM